MPWGNNNGNGNNDGPWGSPSGGNNNGGGDNNGGGNRPNIPDPDFDEIVRKSREKIKGTFGGGSGKWLVALILFIILGFWLSQGVYEVNESEEAVVLRFGEHIRTETAGLHYHFPEPIERVIIVPVTQVRKLEIGFRSRANGDNVEVTEEATMLTADRNIADVPFEVQWVINNAEEFLFNVKDPENTVKQISESAMREVVGRSKISDIIANKEYKIQIQIEAKKIIQSNLDRYAAGIGIQVVQLKNTKYPYAVRGAFTDVQNAKSEKESAINKATAYEKDIIPRAKGQASQMLQEAEAYREQVVKNAEGQASRFNSIYEKYAVAKDVTRKRMYIEAIEEVFSDVDKIIIDNKSGNGVLPYLPLNEMRKGRK